MVDVFGAPFDLCGYRPGSRLGPDAIRLAGLQKELDGIGVASHDQGDLESSVSGLTPGAWKSISSITPYYQEVKSRVAQSLRKGNQALVLGGDHSISLGSVAAAREVYGDDLAVLWVDAHADLNSPVTSPSGNLHGMVLAALTNRKWLGPENAYWKNLSEDQRANTKAEWEQLIKNQVGSNPIPLNRVGWFGLRDVDSGESEVLLAGDAGFCATMADIDRLGVVDQLTKVDQWLRRTGATKFWLSFDVDALDPFLAPGTGTAVRGGLSYREMHTIGELFFEILSASDCPYELVGLDLVEVNPLIDTNNTTAKTAVEWLASLMGKTILGKR